MTERLTTGLIAERVGAELIGPPDLEIRRVLPLSEAGPDAITFARDARFASRLSECRAGAALITRGLDTPGVDTAARALIVVDDADAALVAVLRLFEPTAPEPEPGVHPSAVVHESARLGDDVRVGPGCVVGPGCRVGDKTVLVADVTLVANVSIGSACVLHPGVRFLDRCSCGDKCIIHANTVVGSDGFGYIPDPAGGLMKVPQIGDVRIGDAVEIGAGTMIDRAKMGSTRIGDGTKIDNLVQIGHNCVIGRHCVLCGQVGLAGSVTIGDGAMLGGQVGVADNLSIGAGAEIGAQAGLNCDVPPGARFIGSPAGPLRTAGAGMAAIERLPKLMRRINRLERALIEKGIVPPPKDES